jgi:hypothetical protein
MNQYTGNSRLKAARQHAGYATQQALADALTRAAPKIGLGRMEVNVRQVRRWESESPPWPRADHQRVLVHVLQLPVDQLGFTPPWDSRTRNTPDTAPRSDSTGVGAAVPLPTAAVAVQPQTVGADYASITDGCIGVSNLSTCTPPWLNTRD